MAQVIGFAGYSDSGKTTVISNLISILKKRGYRVAAVKHAAHGYDVDIPGKDSWLHFQAGADKVIIVGPGSLTIHERFSQSPDLKSILDKIVEMDFILIEGFKTEPGPKVEIVRKESDDRRLPLGNDLVAVISDVYIPGLVPCFSFEQLEELLNFLLTNNIGATGN